MRADTLSARILLAYVALLTVLLGAATVAGRIWVGDVVRRDVERRKAVACEVFAPSAVDVLTNRGDVAALARHVRDVATLEGLRMTIVAPDGTVVAESEAEGPLANHRDRPEIAAALATGSGRAQRRSATTGKETIYLARAVRDGDRVVGVVRAAIEVEDLDALLAPVQRGIAWFGVGAFVVGIAAALGVARWLARPLEEIERGAASLAAGDLETRVEARGPREVRRLADTLNDMSTDLRRRLEAQRRARIEIETILSSMAEGVVAVGSDERVILMNDAAARLLGLEGPLDSGAALWEHLRHPDLERALRGVLNGRAAWHGDATAPRADGRVLALSVAPVDRGDESDRDARPGAVALLSDVTAIRRLEQVRIDFVANVSHELRTPLAAVMGALETLGDPAADDDVRARFLDIGNRNAARLQAIVSDLLDLSSIEADGDRMPLEPVRVDGPLRTAASALAGAAEAKGVVLEMPPATPVPAWVNGNAQRLEQVFTNLLENALKYTPRGGRVRARVRTSPREVSVDVEDTGVGIPAQHLPRVFERFYRVDRSRSREMGGTGLGLSIVKHVLRAHGGQVSVTSEEGRGSTFTVTLPRLADPDRPRATDPERIGERNGRDDDPERTLRGPRGAEPADGTA